MIFDVIKNHIPLRLAMERYGVSVNHAGKCLCPFHDDHSPSMSLKDNKFKCFACNAGGDIFDFVMLYFHIGLYHAVNKIDRDFCLGLCGKDLTVHEKRIIREEIRRRNAARLIEQAKNERENKELLKKCDLYRKSMYFIQENAPTEDGWAEAFNTIQYLEYWFKEKGW